MENITWNKAKEFLKQKKLFGFISLSALIQLIIFWLVLTSFYKIIPTFSEIFLEGKDLSFLSLNNEFYSILLSGAILFVGFGISVLMTILGFWVFFKNVERLQALIPNESRALFIFKCKMYAIAFAFIVLVDIPAREGLWLAEHVSFY